MEKDYKVFSFAAGYCYSYFITGGDEVLVVDPHITLVDEYDKTLRKQGLTLVGIFDTHTHADHISSAAILKDKYNVPVYMSEKAVSSVATDKVTDGSVIKIGQTEVKAIYTPGHTDDSVSLITPQGDLFTGDVLLINSVGRTDFQNGSPEDMFESLAKLGALPENTTLRPAHDYKGNKTSTVAEQKTANPFVAETDKGKFCENARSKKLAKPTNIEVIVAANQKGSATGLTIVSPKTAGEKISDENTILLDVRTDQELNEISLKSTNFKHVPLQSLGGAMGSLPADATYYILCRYGNRATIAAKQLMQNGFGNVNIIEGGIIAWEKAGLPVTKTEGPISIERQVRIIAGSLVITGVLLSLLNTWFLLISAFVACGLIFAGITNSCMMGTMLMKLPYNKAKTTPSATGGGCSLDGDSGNGGCSMDSNDTGGGCAM
ncbi:MAG: MBL fold metallo-hydrolase [Phycisphaerae bacterium]|nr:MBL fold metallo-hydrolase [Phycisphaerae bacterium]